MKTWQNKITHMELLDNKMADEIPYRRMKHYMHMRKKK